MRNPMAKAPAPPPATLVSPALAVPPVQSGIKGRMRVQRPATHAVERWSRFVRTMRWVLPGVAVLLVAALIASLVLGGGAGMRRDGGELVMSKPRYTGTTEDSTAYTVEADAARHVGGDEASARVELTKPFAGVTLSDGSYLGLRAAAGLLDQAARSLSLTGGVQLFSDQGYRLETATAELSGDSRRAWGDSPVAGWGPRAKLSAAGFRIEDKGETLIFTGPARLTLTVPAAEPDPSIPAQTVP